MDLVSKRELEGFGLDGQFPFTVCGTRQKWVSSSLFKKKQFTINGTQSTLLFNKAALKVIKVSKLNLKGFSHTVRETKPLVVLKQKTIIGFLVETSRRLINKPLRFQVEAFSRPFLNIFIEIWYNNETLLFLSFLSIDNDVLFRGPRAIDFKQTCISDLIFVGLYKQKI